MNDETRKAKETLRQTLAQPVDAVNMSQERVDETAKDERKWVGLTDKDKDKVVESLNDFYSIEDVMEAVAKKLKEKNA